MIAVDVHVHSATRGLDLDACAYFRRDPATLPRSEEEVASLYVKKGLKGLVIAWHPSTAPESPRMTNEHAIELATKYPAAFAGVLASLDMAEKPDERIRRAKELLKDPNVKGFKFHPPGQGFYPDDRKYYDLWEVLAEGRKPLMFHTGFTVLGAESEGGKGIALDCARPIRLDNLARDFPTMKIVAAHPGWPWHEELIGVALHKKNIYVDTSGYLPDQLPEIFQKAIQGRLQDRALFGTDFPYVDPEKALESFEKLGMKSAVKEKIFAANARALFGI